ncbi:MAG TPA: hypothetical protein VM097_01355 [Mycobacteriales bacterium]|nr:hypothetical protein [Mycobacteriales bacterium]
MTEPLGSAAEEAARLFAAAQEWARARFDHEHLATGSVECQVCPVCQGIAALRQVRPETVEHLLDSAASFVAALTSAFPQPEPDDGPRPGSVQHIDVQGD